MESPMKKYCKALVNLGVAAIMLLLVLFLLPKLFLFFLPFVIGWIIALIASPLVRFFEEKVKIKRKAGSAVVIIVVIALVVLVLYLILARLVEELTGLINALPDMWANVQEDLEEAGERLNVLYTKLPEDVQSTLNDIGAQASSYVGDIFGRISSPTIAAVGNFAKQLPSVLIATIMCLLSSYFFVADRNQINEWCRANMPHFLQNWYRMIRRSMVHSVGGYFKAQLKIEIWIYILLVIGLSILRVDYVLLIALGIAVLDFLPVFGTGTVMMPWAIIKILGGNYQMAVGLLIIWGVGQLVRQIIQPKIVGDSVGVPPIPTLFLLFVGYRVAGVFGMILAVPLGLILYTLYMEGAFDTTKNSLLILTEGINRFRRLNEQDLEEIHLREKEVLEERKKDSPADKKMESTGK